MNSKERRQHERYLRREIGGLKPVQAKLLEEARGGWADLVKEEAKANMNSKPRCSCALCCSARGEAPSPFSMWGYETECTVRYSKYQLLDELNVSWDDISGLEAEKAAIRAAIEFPVTHANLYAAYGQRPAKGILLCGPPGCGKTMLAKAAASALAKSGQGCFMYAKGPELFNMYVGETEKQIRGLFESARRYKKATGRAAVIFLDEADALLSDRANSGQFKQGVVATFLAELDGLKDAAAFVILATNLQQSIDPAVVRDGRIDRKVLIPRPDREIAERIFQERLRSVPIHGDYATRAADLVFSDALKVLSVELAIPPNILPEPPRVELYMRDLVSGAIIAGCMQRAVERAIQRDITAGHAEPSGLYWDDLQAGIQEAAAELKNTNLHAELFAKAQETLSHLLHEVKPELVANAKRLPAGGLN